MSNRPQNPNQPDQKPIHGVRELFGPGWPPAELKPHERNLCPAPNPIDSGFDDPALPEYPFLKQEQDDETTSLKPWPLAFAIFGLGLLLAIAFALLFSGCAQTSITTKYFTMKTQANLKNFTATETTFHADEINHSTPTFAGGKAFSNGTATFGSAATGLAAGLLSHGGL